MKSYRDRPSKERPLKDEDFRPEDMELIAFRMLKGSGNPWFFLLTARVSALPSLRNSD